METAFPNSVDPIQNNTLKADLQEAIQETDPSLEPSAITAIEAVMDDNEASDDSDDEEDDNADMAQTAPADFVPNNTQQTNSANVQTPSGVFVDFVSPNAFVGQYDGDKQASTRGLIRTWFNRYGNWINEKRYPIEKPWNDGDTLRYLAKGPKIIGADLIAFFTFLRDGDELTPGLAANSRKSCKMWMKQYLQVVNRQPIDDNVWRAVKRLLKGDTEAHDKIPELGQAWRILNNMPLASKSFYLTMMVLGARFHELHELTERDIRLDTNDGRFRVEFKVTKTDTTRPAWMTREASRILLQWLEARPFDERRTKDDERIWPFDEKWLRSSLYQALDLSGIKLGELGKGERNPYHPHSTGRKFFVTYGKFVLGLELAQGLTGHKHYMGAYEKEHESMIKSYFVRAEDMLTLNLNGLPRAEPKSEVTMVERQAEDRQLPQQQSQVPTFSLSEQINSQLQQRMETPQIPQPQPFMPFMPRIVPIEIPKMPTTMREDPMVIEEDDHTLTEMPRQEAIGYGLIDQQGEAWQSQQSDPSGSVSQERKETGGVIVTSTQPTNQQREIAAMYSRDRDELVRMRKDPEVRVEDLEATTGKFIEKWGQDALPPEDHLTEPPPKETQEDVQQIAPTNLQTELQTDSNVMDGPVTPQPQAVRKTRVLSDAEEYALYFASNPQQTAEWKEKYGDSYGV